MARVRDIRPEELPPELAAIYRKYAAEYGPFGNQVAAFAHVPEALRHLMPMLMELRAAGRVKRKHLELAIVVVSGLNACHYCIGHHKPFLEVEGMTSAGVDRVIDYADHPELDETDKLVVEYAIAAESDPRKVSDALFARMRRHFSEAEIVELTLRITLTGFFNRFTEALRIEEEPAAAHAAE